MVSGYRRKQTSPGQVNIPALEQAISAGQTMQESRDENLSHIGTVIERITSRKLEIRKNATQSQKTSSDRGTEKFFYTSAHASERDD